MIKIFINKLKRIKKSIVRVPQNFFVVIAFLSGTLFVFLIPPFQNPDETVHFYRAYQIAELDFVSSNVKSSVGGILPESIRSTSQINSVGLYGADLPFNTTERYSIAALKASLKIPLDSSKRELVEFPSSSIYSPISYVPHSLGIAVANLFSAPVVVALYLARLFGLVFFVAVGYSIIRFLPRYKWAYAGVLLLPMALVQATAVTADTVLNASIALLVSLVLFGRTKMKLNITQLMLIIISSVAIVLSKQIFVLLIPIIFLLPSTVFRTKIKKYMFAATTCIVAAIAYVAWYFIGSSGGINGTVSATNGASFKGQVNYLINNIIDVPVIFQNTFLTQHGDGIYTSLAGNFGWLDTPLPFVGVLIVFTLLLFIFFIRYEKPEASLTQKTELTYNISISVIALLLFMAIGMALYVAWTPVGAEAISGLQGRYYIPILLILASLSVWKNSIFIKERQYIKILIGLIVISHLFAVATIAGRYFIT